MPTGDMEKVVIFGTSTKSDGPMGPIPDASQNIKRFIEKLCGVDPGNTVFAQLVHSNHVAFADKNHMGVSFPQCDGLMTTECDIPLFIRTQDCIPVFLWDEKRLFVGLLHAGWKNILSGIVPHAIQEIERRLGIPPERISITLGPHIHPCCYEVKEDLLRRLNEEYFVCVHARDSKFYLDLGKIITLQSASCGVPYSNIRENPECTCHTFDTTSHKYFSWRREGVRNRNMGSAIILRQKM